MESPRSSRKRRTEVVLAGPFFVGALVISLVSVAMFSRPSAPALDVSETKEHRERADQMIEAMEVQKRQEAEEEKRKTSDPPKTPVLDGPTEVSPVFAWPQDISRRVDYTKSVRAGGKFIPVTRLRFTMKAPQKGELRVLELSDLVKLTPSGEEIKDEDSRLLLRQQGLGELLAHASVDAQGALQSANTSKDLVKRAREAMFGTATPEPSPQTVRVSEALVEDRTRLFWSTLVGHWANKTWTQNKEVPMEFEALSPSVGILKDPIPHRALLSYLGSDWCDPDARKKKCAIFQMVLSSDTKYTTKAMEAAINAAGDNVTAKIQKIHLYERHLLATDAATLIPHRHTIDTFLSFKAMITLPGQGAQPQENRAETRVERVYFPESG